jgi:hypothetical protein
MLAQQSAELAHPFSAVIPHLRVARHRPAAGWAAHWWQTRSNRLPSLLLAGQWLHCSFEVLLMRQTRSLVMNYLPSPSVGQRLHCSFEVLLMRQTRSLVMNYLPPPVGQWLHWLFVDLLVRFRLWVGQWLHWLFEMLLVRFRLRTRMGLLE